MSDRENSGITLRNGGRSARSGVLSWMLASAALTALVFVPAASSQAQSQQDTTSKSAPASAPAPANIAVAETAVVAQTATAKPAAAPAGQSAPKGQQEGIRVHGHWVIEVRNPDGTVASHHEFQNEIGVDGGNILAGLLQGYVVPQGFVVRLQGGVCGQSPQCYLASSTAPCSEAALYGGQPCLDKAISAIVPTTTFDGIPSGPLTLTGSFPATQSGVISAVYSELNMCLPVTGGYAVQSSTYSPKACAQAQNGITADVVKYNLTGTTLSSAANCGTAGQLPCQVNVSQAGQTVLVTVQISFGSASATGLSSAAVLLGGMGYQVGDIVAVSGGTGGTVQVSAVNGTTGAATAVSLYTPGTGYSNGVEGTTETTTGGTGTGLTLNIVIAN
jgi:hypothetical protein